jgi:large subunit ribosomal protein L15
MLNLSNLSPKPGSRKNRKRVGRGPGSGHGKTATRGHKGYKSRSGSSVPAGFEGGQMPLHRRLPKRGFNNLFRKEYAIVKVGDLNRFEAGATVDREALVAGGLVGKKAAAVKLLADGELDRALTVKVDKASAAAVGKVEAAGGKVEVA